MLLDDGHTYAFAPYAELFYGCGTEGVGGAQVDFLAGRFILVGQFADGGRFAHAVHAHDHHYVGFMG